MTLHTSHKMSGLGKYTLNINLSWHSGGDDEICPYATFHLLGFREEMDPQQAGNNFQTFPHQNGHGSQQHFVNSPASRSMVSANDSGIFGIGNVPVFSCNAGGEKTNIYKENGICFRILRSVCFLICLPFFLRLEFYFGLVN